MPLLRRVARVAAIGAVAGGTAGAVQHRQQGRWARQEEEQMAAQQTAVAPPPPEASSMDKLKELGQLHESGVLTDEEFAAAKAKILNI
jgi:hypothetical protein